jgi:hypothetical protein
VGRVPAKRPEVDGQVLVVGCPHPYGVGLYSLSDLAVPRPLQNDSYPQLRPRKTGEVSELMKEARWVVVEHKCEQPVPMAGLTPLGHRRGSPELDFYLRR